MEVVSLCVLEDELCIEQFLVDVLWGIVSSADYEDFGRDETRGFGLSCLYACEKLLEHPHEGLEIGWAEHLGYEVPAIL